MGFTEFLELSPMERLKFAPILAKYNVPCTAAFQKVIELINRGGLGVLNPNTLLNLFICLGNVPTNELQTIKS